MSIFLDTNILIYAALGDGPVSTKQYIADGLLDRNDCHLSAQTLQEFVSQATRASRSDRISFERARAYVAVWCRFPVQQTTLELIDVGFSLIDRYKLSFWDGMIVAAARLQNCEILYSEDMQDGAVIDGMAIRNPFI